MSSIDTTPETVEERAVRYFEALKGVSEAQVTGKIEVASGVLVTVRHKRGGNDTWGWYFENSKMRTALNNTLETAKFIERQVQPPSLSKLISETPFTEIVKLSMMSFLTIVFSFATLYLVITQPDNKSIQIITGLLGLTLGYFLGKVELAKVEK